MARSITSCTFIIRSISAAEIAGLVASTSQRHLPPGFKRTDHVLLGPDRSHANNIAAFAPLTPPEKCSMLFLTRGVKYNGRSVMGMGDCDDDPGGASDLP